MLHLTQCRRFTAVRVHEYLRMMISNNGIPPFRRGLVGTYDCWPRMTGEAIRYTGLKLLTLSRDYFPL